jgi:hypothetical protein
MVCFMMRSFALITAMIMSQPGLSAPAIEAIRPDRLPEDVRGMLTDRPLARLGSLDHLARDPP